MVAIKKLNLDLGRAGLKRFLDISESRRCRLLTFILVDPTSRRWDVGTSQRGDFATLGRRDVGTSRRWDVATF